jgi:hypothetical protein
VVHSTVKPFHLPLSPKSSSSSSAHVLPSFFLCQVLPNLLFPSWSLFFCPPFFFPCLTSSLRSHLHSVKLCAENWFSVSINQTLYFFISKTKSEA